MMDFSPGRGSIVSAEPALSPDAALIETFLGQSLGASIHLVSIVPDKGAVIGRWFGAAASAATWAVTENANGKNVYWTVNTTPAFFGGKPAKKDITAARFVHVDVDPPFDRAGTLAKLADFASPPSFVIDSGNGLQAFWRLEEPAQNLPAVEAINQRMAQMLGGDHCHNIDRLMRLPGTINWPTVKKAALGRVPVISSMEIPDEGECCDIAQIDAALPVLQASAPAPAPSAPTTTSAVDHSAELVAIGIDPSSHVAGLIARPAGADRSRDAYAVACEMVRLGFDDDAIVKPLVSPTLPIGAHCNAQQQPERAARRAIEKARAEPANDRAPSSTAPQGASADFQALDLWPVLHTAIAPPEFPRHVLGPLWADWVAGKAGAAGAPISYVAICLLVGAATLIGNARRVTHGEWREPAILWGMMVGNPSSGKTPALRPVQSLLNIFDRDIAAGYPAAKAAHQAKEATALIAKEAWAKAVKHALSHNQDAPPMPAAANAPDAPICPALVVQDVTPEKLGYLSNASPKGLMMLRDEAAGWLGNMNRFSGGGERQAWLEAYNGDPSKIDRVKLDGSIYIEHFSVSVLGGIQPDRLNMILRDDPDDGLIPRFLFAYPDPVPPTRAAVWTPSFDTVAVLRSLFELRLAKFDDTSRPHELPLSATAADRFEEWRQAHHIDSSTVEGMAMGSWGKMPGQLLRLSLVLELLTWADDGFDAEPTTVGIDALSGAIELIETFFKPMARRTLGDAGASPKIHAAKALAAYIVKMGITVLDTRPVMSGKGCPTMLRKPEHMDPACAELVDAGWLKPVADRAGGSKGKLPKAFTVNPALWAELSPVSDKPSR